MKFIREPVWKWLGFTRRERSSALILLVIIMLVFAFRYTVPVNNMEIEDITSSFYSVDNSSGSHSPVMSSGIPLFLFDPNTASYDTLIILGFDAKVANTLINFRSKGGKFYRPSDIRKIYGLTEKKADELIPFVDIKTVITKQSEKEEGKQKISLIDVNNCDSAMLVRLPGIGPVLAARIVKFRDLLGGYARVEQLLEVYGLPEETYRLIRGRIFIDTLALTRVNVNSASFSEFTRLPYFDRYEVTAILKYRELEGRIERIDDLIDNKLITEEKIIKLRPYLSFD